MMGEDTEELSEQIRQKEEEASQPKKKIDVKEFESKRAAHAKEDYI